MSIIFYLDELHDVKQTKVPVAENKVARVIAAIRTGMEALKITPVFLPVPTFEDRSGEHKYGVGFAVDKLEESFAVTVRRDTFSYRDGEVRKLLEEIVHEHNLAPVIRWDRGSGVFVWNLYFSNEDFTN